MLSLHPLRILKISFSSKCFLSKPSHSFSINAIPYWISSSSYTFVFHFFFDFGCAAHVLLDSPVAVCKWTVCGWLGFVKCFPSIQSSDPVLPWSGSGIILSRRRARGCNDGEGCSPFLCVSHPEQVLRAEQGEGVEVPVEGVRTPHHSFPHSSQPLLCLQVRVPFTLAGQGDHLQAVPPVLPDPAIWHHLSLSLCFSLLLLLCISYLEAPWGRTADGSPFSSQAKPCQDQLPLGSVRLTGEPMGFSLPTRWAHRKFSGVELSS